MPTCITGKENKSTFWPISYFAGKTDRTSALCHLFLGTEKENGISSEKKNLKNK